MNSPVTSPLAIDLTGAGIQTTALAGSQTFFDMASAGHGVQTGWLSASCAFLARPNADGSITSVSNLFGNDSANPNGFQSLAALDSNHDGAISAADAAFVSLVVWSDLNGDGVAESGETQTLAAVGITSISLSYTTVLPTAPGYWNNGNEIRQTANVTFADGAVRQIADVWFATNPMASQWAWHAPTAAEALLPDLPASGNLDSLQQSYAADPALEQMVTSLTANAATMSYTGFRSAVETLVTHWALSSGVVIAANPTVAQQRSAVLEALGGQAFVNSAFNANQSGLVIGGNVDAFYGALIDWMAAAIAIQIGQGSCAGALSPALAAMYAGYNFDPDTGALVVPPDATFAQMRANGTFSQALFQYVQGGATGPGPTSDPIWALVADWATGMPAGADLTKYLIRQDLDVLDTEQVLWGGVWAAPGVLDLMYAVGAPYLVNGYDGVFRFGADLLVFMKGCGNQMIYGSAATTGGKQATLYMSDVVSSDVRFDGTSGSLVMTVISTGEKIAFADDSSSAPNAFANGGALAKIVFADGVVIDHDAFMALNRTVVFGKGDFAEVAPSSTAADTFVYARGDGVISIDAHLATGQNVLRFADLATSDLSFTMDAAKNLIIADGVTGDRVTILGQFSGATRIASFQFADGATLAAADIQRKLVPSASVVLAHGVSFTASYAEIVDASAGADIVTGSIYNDRFIAGPGDTLQGGLGADLYDLAAGSGAVTINDLGSDKAADVVRFAPGSGILQSNVTFRQSGLDLVMQYGATDVATLKGWISQNAPGNACNDQIVFADGSLLTVDQAVALSLLTPGQTTLRADWRGDVLNGTAGADALYGGAGADTFNPGKGTDTISGGGGADVLNYKAGDGAKTWSEVGSGAQVLQFGAGVTAANLAVTQSGANLILKDGVAGDQITLSAVIGKTAPTNFDGLVARFEDGSQKTLEQLVDQSLQGTAGGLSLSGDYHGNLLFGRPNDTLYGGGGMDTFRFEAGFGKESIMDFTPTGAQADIMDFASSLFANFAAVQGAMSQSGANTLITKDAADVITLAGVQMSSLTAGNFAFH